MQGASKESLGVARDRLEDYLADASAEDVDKVSAELFSAARLFEREPVLRRTLSDSSAPESARSELLDSLLSGQLSDPTMQALRGVVTSRWSTPADLVDAIETLGRQVVFAGAERAGTLDEVEDELFRFGRILDREPQLAIALSDRAAPPEGRQQLLDSLLSGKVQPATEQLLNQAIAAPRALSLERAIDELSDLAAVRRDRSLARVRTAVALTDEQEQRLAAALGRIYRRDVVLQVEVDPQLLGGLVVQVGGDVIDGTVARKLDQAARGLTR